MTMPRYAINSEPQMMPRRPGPLAQLGQMAAQKGLSAGINAAVPGGGFAAEAAQQILPGVLGFEEGGDVEKRAPGRGGAAARTLRKAWDWWKGKSDDNSTAQHKEGGGWLDYIWQNDNKYRDRPTGGGSMGSAAGALSDALSYAWKNQNLQDQKGRWAKAGKWSSGAYKADGGEISMPMPPHGGHMNAKVGPLAKTVVKTPDGGVTERAYHDPNKPKPAASGNKPKPKS